MKVIGGTDTDGEFIATTSSSLENGDTIILNNDGTVARVFDSSQQIGAESDPSGTDVSVSEIRSDFDGINNKFVVVYTNNANQYGYIVIGELKGTTLTWGTPQAFTDHTCANIDVACTDQGTGRVVVCYRNNSIGDSPGQAKVGTINADGTVTFGTAVTYTIRSSTTYAGWYNRITLMGSPAGRVTIVYREGSTTHGYVALGTVATSGNSITFNDPVQFSSGNCDNFAISRLYDGTQILVAWSEGAAQGKCRVGTVQGNPYQIVFGNNTVDFSGGSVNATFNAITYVSDDTGQVYGTSSGTIASIAYKKASNGYGMVNSGVVTGTGTSANILFSSDTTFHGGACDRMDIVYDDKIQKIIVSYRDPSNRIRAIVGRIFRSGSTLYTYFPPDTDAAMIADSNADEPTSIAFGKSISGTNPDIDKAIVLYRTGQAKIRAKAFQPKHDFTFQAANGGYQSVINDATSSGGNRPYAITYDTDKKRYVVFFRSGGNGIAHVGSHNTNLEGGISWGGAGSTQFTTATPQDVHALYDPVQKRVVVFFVDTGDSYRLKCRTGVVDTSNDTISFSGTSTTTLSSSTASDVTCCYVGKSPSGGWGNRVAIAWKDSNNNGKGVAALLTYGSNGVDLSLGSIVPFTTGTAEDLNMVWHEKEHKLVIVFMDKGDSDKGKAIAFHIDAGYGGGLYPGSAQEFVAASLSGSPNNFGVAAKEMKVVYNDLSITNKNLAITYQFSNNYSYALLAALSGTSFSFYSSYQIASTSDSLSTTMAYLPNVDKYVFTNIQSTKGRYYWFEADYVSGELTFNAGVNWTDNYILYGYPFPISTPVYNPDVELPVYVFRDNASVSPSDQLKVTSITLPGTNLRGVNSSVTYSTNYTYNNANLLGFSSGSYLTSTSSTVTLPNSIINNLTGLTTGAVQYVKDSGSLTTSSGAPSVEAGISLSTTKLIVKG